MAIRALTRSSSVVQRHGEILVREGERQAALRDEVDDQHALVDLGEGCSQGGDGGRLGHATLLVGDGDGPGHAAS
jgi:hypothetical protein